MCGRPARAGRCRSSAPISSRPTTSSPARMCRAWRPEIYHYDPAMFALVMEQLSPHIIMRRGLIAGRRYPQAARHVGDYIARASFFTSDLAIPLEKKFDGVADFANNQALRRITAELVFTDPYRVMERNRWTSPELDDVAARIRADGPLKIAAARRGHQFLASSQALIHGDLHTGSVMVTETRHARHRSRIRGLRADRLRSRRVPRQSPDELLFAARPRHRRRRPPRPAGVAARTDPDLLAELCRAVRSALARPCRRRRLSERPVRRALPTRPPWLPNRSASLPSFSPT